MEKAQDWARLSVARDVRVCTSVPVRADVIDPRWRSRATYAGMPSGGAAAASAEERGQPAVVALIADRVPTQRCVVDVAPTVGCDR